ncbi:Tripartite tricarboxylate transporter TctB family protein [Hyphomicrobiales bacterium]|nr:Tripartite tricarboxylate transporter TctB family protein [Hyphomicrobiales bacterium]CAH1694792.1 Tripartite tricarboxylate transporter TctB family protein [Hyphomicrobiales bacterium]
MVNDLLERSHSVKRGNIAGRVDLRDLAVGIALLAIAMAFAVLALRRLALGTPSSMGPGFFPVMIAAALAVTAGLILVRAFGRATEPTGFLTPRAFLCILGAPIAFALAIGPLGFIPTLVLTTLLGAWSSKRMTWAFALSLTAGLTALCTVLFVKMLQMPVPLFGPWLDW